MTLMILCGDPYLSVNDYRIFFMFLREQYLFIYFSGRSVCLCVHTFCEGSSYEVQMIMS